MIKPEYFFGMDFDGAQAKTFTPPPGGEGVKSASDKAVREVCGSIGFLTYLRNGGLANRSPVQVIQNILSNNPESRERILASAKRFHHQKANSLVKYVPEAEKNGIVWDEENPEKTLTQLYLGAKLNHLVPQIGQRDKYGTIWPEPCLGFPDFMNAVQELRSQNIGITLATVSSGHDSFIKRVYEVWELPEPDILITEDTIRPIEYPKDPAIRFKPGPFPLALAHYKWAMKLGEVDDFGGLAQVAQRRKTEMGYFGDDHIKDGKMANGYQISFGHFINDSSAAGSSPYAPDWTHPVVIPEGPNFIFSNWKHPAEDMKNSLDLMKQGRPLSEVFQERINHTNKLRSL